MTDVHFNAQSGLLKAHNVDVGSVKSFPNGMRNYPRADQIMCFVAHDLIRPRLEHVGRVCHLQGWDQLLY